MSHLLLHEPILSVLIDQFHASPHVVSLLSRTCKSFRDGFPRTQGMRDLTDWLVRQEALLDSRVVDGGNAVFRDCKIERGKRGGREWRVKARCGRKMSGFLFDHLGVIRVGKCSASLVILGWYRECEQFKDSFYGIQDLDALNKCLASHTILCHEMPEKLPDLPKTVVHRHRDNVPWTFARAFYVWRATRPVDKRRAGVYPEMRVLCYGVVQEIDGQRVETWHMEARRDD